MYLSLLELGHGSGLKGSEGVLGEVHVSQIRTSMDGLGVHEGNVVAREHEHGEGGEVGHVVGGQLIDLEDSVSSNQLSPNALTFTKKSEAILVQIMSHI